MAVRDVVGRLLGRGGRQWSEGGADIADARRLADAERVAGEGPDGCAWLDERTVDDVDLALVFQAVDRTTTPTGAQALWRWLVAPAVRGDVLAHRERMLARFAGEPELRERVRDALVGHYAPDAVHLPRLLWEAPAQPLRRAPFVALLAALVVFGVLAVAWYPPLAAVCLLVVIANVVVDDWASLRLAHHGRALEVLSRVLDAAERVIERGLVRDAAIARDLAALAGMRRRISWLTLRDPLEIGGLVRAVLLVRVLLHGWCLRAVERERDRLRRLVLWTGELDASAAVASLRAEREDARLPQWTTAGGIRAGALVHPAIPRAIGNDLAIGTGLIVTGSNMSGKSTFLRAIAINAICAQSIHTTFGTWCAPMFRVFSVMRVADATAAGMSTYAIEVASVGRLVDAAASGELDGVPGLFVIDEPFRGTNPALRVPIAVSVLDYLAGGSNVVIAATHDLDVAGEVDARFARGYFCEPDPSGGVAQFDRVLRPGIAPTSNAVELLVRAGYPPAILHAVQLRIAGAFTSAS